jgi:pimeloyl-ACP methyl ester carboxylesterase
LLVVPLGHLSITNMDSAKIDNITIAYEECGSGEPVIFIHGSFLADSFKPLLAEPSLNKRYRLINYHRCGYVGSSRLSEGSNIEQQANECILLLKSLGLSAAHVVSHSYGCLIALKLAILNPAAVSSLTLLEPSFPPNMLSDSSNAIVYEPRFKAHKMYLRGNITEAIDLSLELALGREYRQTIEHTLPPNAFNEAVASADAYFQFEERIALYWSLTRDDAKNITQPVLSVLGSNSHERFHEAHAKVLTAFIPQTELSIIPNTTHLMQMMSPQPIASGIAEFISRHLK